MGASASDNGSTSEPSRAKEVKNEDTKGDDNIPILSARVCVAKVKRGVGWYTVFAVGNDRQWATEHRYSHFSNLDIWLRLKYRIKFPTTAVLPPKRWKLTTDHTDPGFLESRRVALGTYLTELLSEEATANSQLVRKFLTKQTVN